MSKVKRIIILTLFALCGMSLVAGNNEDYLKRNKMIFDVRIEKVNKKLAEAQKERDKEVKKAISEYIKVLEKVKTYWTKKGDLEKAIKYKNEIEEMQELVSSPSKSASVPAPKKETKETLAKFKITSPYNSAQLANGVTVLSDRDYKWSGIPADFPFNSFTKGRANGRGSYSIMVEKSGYLYIGGSLNRAGYAKWEKVGWKFVMVSRTASNSSVRIYRKKVRMGSKVTISRTGFSVIVFLNETVKGG